MSDTHMLKPGELAYGRRADGSVYPLKVENDGTLDVNATVSVTSSGAAIEDGADPSIKATVKDYTDSNPLAVVLVDTSGDAYVASGGGGGGTSSTFGAAFPATGTAVGASDGADMQPLLVDGSGFLKVNVAAGSGGNSAAGATGAAVPADADYIGIKDSSGNLMGVAGTNLDYDSGAGTAAQTVFGIALPASGGPVAGGTATNPLRTDPTGTTAQPITDNGGSLTVDGSVIVTQATGTNLHTVIDSGTVSTITNVVHVDDNGGSITVDGPLTDTQLRASAVPISAASLPLPTLAATSTKQSDGSQKTQIVDGSGNVIGATSNALDINIKSGNPTTIAVTQATAASLNATVVGTGTFAVQAAATEADGANVTLGAKADAKSTATDTTAVSAMSVLKEISFMEQNPASRAVTNAGTFAVQAAQSGTWTVAPKADVSPSTINITTQDTGSAVTAGFNSQSLITGSPSANSTAAFTLSTVDTVRVMASGTWTGTLQLEISLDGGTTYLVNGGHQTGTSYNIATATSNFSAVVNVAGATHFRVRATAAMTGTATITVTESVDPVVIQVLTPMRIADATTPTQQLAVGSTGAAAVNTAQVNGVTTSTGTGAVGTGSQRVAVGTDTATIAGSAPGTAGTASAQVVTVQGIASMTKLLVTPDSVALPANQSVNMAQVAGTNTVTGGVAGTLAVGGNVATNVAIGTNPVNLGAQAVSAENTAVTATRMAQLVTDLVGKLIVLPYANPENFVSGVISTAMTGTTSTSCVSAPASGLRNYITQITVSNGSTTVPTDILIQDGSGGTTIYVVPAPAGTGTGTGAGGATITFPTPLRQPTTATAIYAANVTTGSSTKISISGYKGV